MKLWKRAAGALKDRNSLIAAVGGIETAIVKATSHDELSMDYENAQRVYRYVRASPSSIRPLVRAISSRVDRTRSWQVALKGLMLMHGVFRCHVPEAEAIGRLPFDLSCFSDAHSRLSRSWGFNLFVRAYFAFLDQRSILFHDINRQHQGQESPIMIQLTIIRKMQSLVDTLARIKPMADNMRTNLIVDAMDCVILEILEMYGRICSGVAELLPKIHSKTGKLEAKTALKIVEESMSQAEDLAKYFTFCREFGVPNSQEIPDFVRVPEEDVLVLEKIVYGDPETDDTEEEATKKKKKTTAVTEEELKKEKKTMVTEKPEDFEEQRNSNKKAAEKLSESVPDLIKIEEPVPSAEKEEIPDLISF